MTRLSSLKSAQFIASVEINGKSVSFFTPPHSEPDFLWVDVLELINAFVPLDDAVALTNAVRLYRLDGSSPFATAINGDRITTIACHSIAQGLCDAIDKSNKQKRKHGGPAFNAYSSAAAHTAIEHSNLGFAGMFEAFGNVGGPFMRSA